MPQAKHAIYFQQLSVGGEVYEWIATMSYWISRTETERKHPQEEQGRCFPDSTSSLNLDFLMFL